MFGKKGRESPKPGAIVATYAQGDVTPFAVQAQAAQVSRQSAGAISFPAERGRAHAHSRVMQIARLLGYCGISITRPIGAAM
jgi:hypothetical protein